MHITKIEGLKIVFSLRYFGLYSFFFFERRARAFASYINREGKNVQSILAFTLNSTLLFPHILHQAQAVILYP